MRLQHLRSATIVAVLAFPVAIQPAATMAQETVEVRMLDRGPEGQPKAFDPALVKVAPGTTVDFVAWDFGHDLVSVDGMRPNGTEAFSAPKNAGTLVTFEKEGVYVYQCAAHKTMGMIGVVVVGDPSRNIETVRNAILDHPELSDNGRERLSRLLEQLN